MKILISFLFLGLTITLFGQKKVIDHNAYTSWKKIEYQGISNDGNYFSYFVTPLKGDGYVYVYNVKTSKLDSIPRAQKPTFTGDNKCLIFKISPGYDTLRTCEIKKIDKTKWPKDSLGIYFLENDSLVKIANVKEVEIPENGEWIGYTVDSNELKGKVKKKKKHYLFKKNKPVEYKSDGKLFTAYNPSKNKKHQYKDITNFSLSENGIYVALTVHQKIKNDSFQLAILETQSGKYALDKFKFLYLSDFVFNKQEMKGAFFSSLDTNKNKLMNLAFYDLATKSWSTLVDSSASFLPKGKTITQNRMPSFTEDGTKLYFGIDDKPKQTPKDTITESEKVNLDIWHYKDKRLQPQQLIELKKDEKKNDLYVYHLESKKFVPLSNDTLSVNPNLNLKGDYLFGVSREQYQGTYNWTSPNLEDHYSVNVQTGEVKSLKKAVGFGGDLSPLGSYYTYFDGEKLNHYAIDLKTLKTICLTCFRKDVVWQTDNNGSPEVAAPFGIIGWFEGEKQVAIQSEYDVWTYDFEKEKLNSLTSEEGLKTKTKIETAVWSSDSVYLSFENMYFKGLNDKTKGNTIYTITNDFKTQNVYSTPLAISMLMRSKNKETMFIRKMSVGEYPDIHVLDKQFTNEKTVSNINPQQKEYNWSTVEMVDWKSYDGIPLQGLLYKPENYDPSKKYPLIVYYYELNSDNLNTYYSPKPTASVVHPTEYASAGYFIFIPDIRYKIGHPAKSAYNCIMSGTDKVLKLYPAIDSTKLGLQGQSWGGYQTAQLITMTTRYAAAMAGAPVTNMFSAYGGIRWGTGLCRQFQYEKQQSRIGATIWDEPELFIENSPQFHLPKVKTPLLIMANDEDGAVPWYQGIELFTGMKRLGKPCWMFNYNGDDHNLTKLSNKIDLSIRMRQYFDYYLQGKPAPKWLTDGIPAIDKGKVTGYETH